MLTSIVLVTYNKLDYTKQCIESVRQHTKLGSYELIAIDNGSTDGTVEWLEKQKDVRVLANGYNAGFPKACNQGLVLAQGELLMLLNNDTLVTSRWLEGLKEALLSDPSVGAVGPVTNNASYLTGIPVSYRTMDEMEQFAVAFNQSDPAKWEERLKLIGYCLLIRRQAYEKIGPLDERFGMGNFEDDDYSLRLRLAGYKLLLCGDTFIHHYGSVSFSEDSVMYKRVLAENCIEFIGKWGFHPAYGMVIRGDMIDIIEREVVQGFQQTTLEIGCGSGATLLRLRHQRPGSRLYGVEQLEAAARIAEACGIEVFRSEQPEDWSIEDGELDGILIGNVHMSMMDAQTGEKWWSRLIRMLKPGGWIVVSFLNRRYFRYANLPPEADQLLFTTEKAERMLAQAGVSVHKLMLVSDNCTAEDEAELERVTGLIQEVSREELATSYFLCFARKPIAQIEHEKSVNQSVLEETDSVRPDSLASAEHAIKEQNDVQFTGERLVVSCNVKANLKDVYDEHMHRYQLAGQLVAGLHVLDAACGTGYGSLMLREAGAVSVTGVDIDGPSVERAKIDYCQDGITFMQGDVLQLPFTDESFDAVVSFETIEHVPKGAAWIREAARVLKVGGLFIVSTPNRAVTNPTIYFEERPFNPHHLFEYRTSELLGELLESFLIEELYGQNWFDDSRFAAMRWLRAANRQQMDREAGHRTPITGSEPIPFHIYKSSEPMYVIAVCRKKKRFLRT
jgi:O-antigen biosynthesis protein